MRKVGCVLSEELGWIDAGVDDWMIDAKLCLRATVKLLVFRISGLVVGNDRYRGYEAPVLRGVKS